MIMSYNILKYKRKIDNLTNVPKHITVYFSMQIDRAIPELMRLDTFLEIYEISRSTYYSHVKNGRLKITKINSAVFIKRDDANDWLKKLTAE